MSLSKSQTPTRSLLSPIFLFSNWRTGGTAFAFTFRKHEAFWVFTEPLNPTLRDLTLALNANTSSWSSKHPKNEYYFKEYEKVLSKDSSLFPNLESIPYVLKKGDKQENLLTYFNGLISYAHSLNKIPVFKLEQSEGSADWIRSNFPDALCVGVSRKPENQYISWLEQASFGNNSFFLLAHKLIENNLDFFDSPSIIFNGTHDIEAYKKTFDVFKKKIDHQHDLFMDFCLDISPESEESLDSQLTKIKKHDYSRIDLWKFVLSSVHDSLEMESQNDVTIQRLTNQIKVLGELASLKEELKNSPNIIKTQKKQIEILQHKVQSNDLMIKKPTIKLIFRLILNLIFNKN